MTIHNQIAKRFYASCNEMAAAYLPVGMHDRNREGRTEVYRELLARHSFEAVLRHADVIAKVCDDLENQAWEEIANEDHLHHCAAAHKLGTSIRGTTQQP